MMFGQEIIPTKRKLFPEPFRALKNKLEHCEATGFIYSCAQKDHRTVKAFFILCSLLFPIIVSFIALVRFYSSG